MTGFATAEVALDAGKLVWEIRSVNHRFLDLGFRLPEDLRSLEPGLRQLIGEQIKRGKVDCSLKLIANDGDAAGPDADPDALAALARLQETVVTRFPGARELTVAEILRWPGVIRERTAAADRLFEPALACFGEAVASLRSAREREGRRLAEILLGNLDAIASLMTGIDEQLTAHAPLYRQKLLERLERLDFEASPERLEQELALIAQRVDVREEADRLGAHLVELRDVIARDEPVGRRLDFLIQELNREANTLASKVQDDVLARRAVDLKVLIEQMREQVQNLE